MKLLLNSLYGILGYRGDSDAIIQIDNKGELKKLVGGKEEGHSKELLVSVAIACAITAMARVRMYDLRVLGIYSDTDSIVVGEQLNPDLVGKELGELRRDGKTKGLVIAGSKLYYGVGVDSDNEPLVLSAASGLPKGTLTSEITLKLYNGEEVQIPRVT